MERSEHKYPYVSFSKPQLASELGKLIDAARTWEPIKGRVIQRFDFSEWLEAACAHSDFSTSFSQSRTTDTSLAAKILDVLLLDRYRKGPVAYVLRNREEFLGQISQRITANEPVEIVIPSFPGRPVNPLTHARTQPDLGEVASLTRLWQISEHVRTLYQPGLQFILTLDGRAYAPFYGYTQESFAPYPADLQRLIDQLGLTGTIQLVDLQSLVDRHFDEFEQIHAHVTGEVEAAWSDTTNTLRDELVDSMKLGTNTAAINAAAIKLIKFYSRDDEVTAAIEQMRQAVADRARFTAFAYMCFLVTLRRMDLIKRTFPTAIRGTVHPKDGQYSPYLVSETTQIPPWHGVAVLRASGRVDSVYESEIFENPTKYTAVFLNGEYTPFYYEECPS